MTTASSIVIIVVLLLVLVALIIGQFEKRKVITTETQEVINVNDDPFLKAQNEFRTTLVNNITAVIGMLLNVKPDLVHVSIEQTNFEQHLITVEFENHLWRLYCNWGRKYIKIAYTCTHIDDRKCVSKKFRLNNNELNYEKIDTFIRRQFFRIMNKYNKTHKAPIKDMIEAAKEFANNKDYSDDAVRDLLFDLWKSYRDTIISNKRTEMDEINFTRLTAYLMRFMPAELIEALKKEKEELDK